MKNAPIVFAKASVLRPAYALREHVKIQQHVSVMALEPDARQKQAIVAFRNVDLFRLFGENVPKEFYILGMHNTLCYVALKPIKEGDNERFGNVFALNMSIVDVVFDGWNDFVSNVHAETTVMPQLRMVVLVNPEQFVQNQLNERLTVIDQAEYNELDVNLSFVDHSYGWEKNDTPAPKMVEKPRFQLKDIPLTTRAARQMVRNSIAEHMASLTEMHTKSGTVLSFDDWMIQSQGVRVDALNDLAAIDQLSDEEYVEAMVTFKKAEAQAYHSQAVKDKTTELHLFDWVKENFGEEFRDLGRAAAVAEIEGFETQGTDMTTDEEVDPAVFVVTFDGTIVENQRPAIGPASPYALSVLKALQKNGHKLFIMTMRRLEDREAMLQFLSDGGVVPIGTIECMYADGEIQREQVTFVNEEDEHSFEFLETDYLIDHRQFNIPTIQLSGRNDAEPTLYWAELTSSLQEAGYLTEEDVQAALEEVSATADDAADAAEEQS